MDQGVIDIICTTDRHMDHRVIYGPQYTWTTEWYMGPRQNMDQIERRLSAIETARWERKEDGEEKKWERKIVVSEITEREKKRDLERVENSEISLYYPEWFLQKSFLYISKFPKPYFKTMLERIFLHWTVKPTLNYMQKYSKAAASSLNDATVYTCIYRQGKISMRS